MSEQKKCPVSHLTTDFGAPVVDNQNSMTAGPRGPLLAQDVWLNEKLANFVREVIPERRMHAKGSGAFGTFTVTKDITQYTRAAIFSKVGKKTDMFARFTAVAVERGGADAACHLDAPFTCYACGKFQPLLDADHSSVLKRLERRREQTIATDKTTGVLWDRAISAGRKVILDCEAILRSGREGE